MTDEEMAEDSFNCKKLLYKSSTDKRSYKDGFLAGLEAGRPEWHKVADGDLPSEEGGWVCNQDGLSCYFDWSGGFTMAIKIYLSGKMSGLTEEEYTRNFQRAALHYQAKGFRVVNPCDLSEKVLRDNPNATYEDFMTRDLVALRTCTHIALIDGWQTSPGAQREKAEAERLGLEVLLYSA